MRQRTIGILQITSAGFFFGFLGAFGKWAYALGLAPGELLSLRFLTAAILLGILVFPRDPGLARIGPAATIRSLALGVFGYALFSSCFFFALRGLSASLTVLLLYTYPLWVTLGELFFLGEGLRRRQAFALVILLGGLVLLLSGEMRVSDPFALLLGMLSSVFYAAYILASRHWLRDVPPVASSFYVMLGAGVVLAALHLRTLPSAGAWAPVMATSVIGTILPISLFLAGLQKLRAAEASMLSLFEPCTGVGIGALVLGDRFGAVQGIGALVIAAGLVLIALPPKAAPVPIEA